LISISAIRDRIFDQRNIDAARFALQSAVAAAGAFAVAHATEWGDPFAAVISAVFVVQPSAGGTASTGWNRLLATAIGAIVGFVMLMIMPPDWGTVAAIGLAMLVVNLIAAFRIDWRYAAIPAAAIALGGGSETLATTIDSATDIAIGVVIGILVSILVWPDTARVRVSRQIRSAIDASASRLRAARSDTPEDAARAARERFYENASTARQTARRLSGEQQDAANQAIDEAELLFNAVVTLRAAAEHEGATPSGNLDALEDAAITAICALADPKKDPGEAISDYEAQLLNLPPKAETSEAKTETRMVIALAARDMLERMKTLTASLNENGQVRSTPFSSLRQAAREVIPG
jgi:uncharacterized membrane protein YccC